MPDPIFDESNDPDRLLYYKQLRKFFRNIPLPVFTLAFLLVTYVIITQFDERMIFPYSGVTFFFLFILILNISGYGFLVVYEDRVVLPNRFVCKSGSSEEEIPSDRNMKFALGKSLIYIMKRNSNIIPFSSITQVNIYRKGFVRATILTDDGMIHRIWHYHVDDVERFIEVLEEKCKEYDIQFIEDSFYI